MSTTLLITDDALNAVFVEGRGGVQMSTLPFPKYPAYADEVLMLSMSHGVCV